MKYHYAFNCARESDMQHLGDLLANALDDKSIVTLSGELGAGKSVLARAIVHALGYPGRVKSPTYTLMETYVIDEPHTAIGSVAHLDLYRLTDAEELHYLGFDDVMQSHGLILIEWPEMAKSLLPDADVAIRISTLENLQDNLAADDSLARDVQIVSSQQLAIG